MRGIKSGNSSGDFQRDAFGGLRKSFVIINTLADRSDRDDPRKDLGDEEASGDLEESGDLS